MIKYFDRPKYLIFAVMLFSSTLLGGCDSSDNAEVAGRSGTGTKPVAVATGAIEVRSALARTVPAPVSQLVFSGFDQSGTLTYGPVAFAKAATIRLDRVPTSVSTLRILYLEGTVPSYLGSVGVQVRPGETTVVMDPDFEEIDFAVTALEVVPGELDLANGESQSLIARGTFADGSTGDVGSLVEWTSDDTGVCTVSNQGGSKGQVSAVSPGQAVVTASLGSLRGQSTVNVGAAAPRALRIFPENGGAATTAVGATLPLRAELVLSDGQVSDLTTQVEWVSDAVGVATVEAGTGLVTGVSSGSAGIEAEYQGLTASLVVEISGGRLLSLDLSPGTSLMHQGLGKTFRATGTYSDGNVIDLTRAADWTSDNSEVATVTNQGFVRAVGDNGQNATLSATFQGVQGTAEIRIGAYLYAAAGSGGIVLQPLTAGGGFTGAQQTFQAGTVYQELVVDSSGRAVFALTSNQTVESFRIEPENGSLTLVDSAACAVTVGASADPTSLAVTPDSRFLYATQRGATTVEGVRVDPDTLELTSLGSVFSGGSAILGLCLDSRGQFLFALRVNEIMRFSIDPLSGGLSPLLPSFTGAPLAGSDFMQASDQGKIYLVNRVTGADLCVFSLDAQGALRPLVGAPFDLPGSLSGTAITRALVLKDGSQIFLLMGGVDGGLVTVNLSPDTGEPGSSLILTPPSPTSFGLTQGQGSDYAYSQAQNSGPTPQFRLLRKGVVGVTQVSSPAARSISVTP